MGPSDRLSHLAPADQPTSIHEITQRLFPAYSMDDGSVHLAGCQLRDHPFVRVELAVEGTSVELFVDEAGHEIDPGLVDSLGMTGTVTLETPPEPIDTDMDEIVEGAFRLAHKRFPEGERVETDSTSIVWCKFAEGKLRFTFGDHSADLSFADWTRLLQAPPYVCPHTQEKTFHIAATDDGRISAADQIGTCAESGRRVLVEELVTCAATGRQVLLEATTTCPVTGDRVISHQLKECDTCGERVNPKVLEGGECAACREPHPVTKSDPTMARLLDEHPRLDRWGRWRISETANVYILLASGWLRRLLVVVDKESLELRRVATRSRMVSGWNVVQPSQYEYTI